MVAKRPFRGYHALNNNSSTIDHLLHHLPQRLDNANL